MHQFISFHTLSSEFLNYSPTFRNLDWKWRTLVHLSSLDSCQLSDSSSTHCSGLWSPDATPTWHHPTHCVPPSCGTETQHSSLILFLKMPYRPSQSKLLPSNGKQVEDPTSHNKEAQLGTLMPTAVLDIRVIIGLSRISKYPCKNNCLNSYTVCG